MRTNVQDGARPRLARRLLQVKNSRLFHQNLLLLGGGAAAGVGSLIYHAVAARLLGSAAYGQAASLFAAFAVGLGIAAVLSLVLAREAAQMVAGGRGSFIGSLASRSMQLVGVAGVFIVLASAATAAGISSFEHLASRDSVIVLGVSLAMAWLVAVPRGILQGLQRFGALALNLAVEPIVRVIALVALLFAGFAVPGAVAAVLAGLGFCGVLGVYSIRDHLVSRRAPVRIWALTDLSLTFTAGIIGIQVLYNQDVILAEHFLPGHDGGIYAALNKIATIVFYLTLSVSQVLFPRVVEAVTKHQHPQRLLLSSAGLLTLLGGAALVVFGLAPGMVVGALYGNAYADATKYVLAVGLIGLGLSFDNLLVQFFMAVRDRAFVPILCVGCAAEVTLIILFHANLGQVIQDVLAALTGLFILLSIRCYFLLRTLAAGAVAA